MAARLCPHCGAYSKFTVKTNDSGFWADSSKRFRVTTTTEHCDNCSGIIVVFTRPGGAQTPDKELISYPTNVPKVDEIIPEKIAVDFKGGINCLSINEYKAAAAMFRRSLQQVMIDKNASGSDLFAQIDDLEKRQIITSQVKNWAHEIRLWGNHGAHPSKDGLDELKREDMEEVKEFLESLFDYIYIMPAKVQTSIANRAAKKNAKS